MRNYVICLRTGSGYSIEISQDGITQELRCDRSYQTGYESYARKDGDAVQVRRESNRLIFSGLCSGKPVNSSIDIGKGIWYGSKLLLRGFIVSDKEDEVFYMSRPEEQKVIKLRADKRGTEEIIVSGKKYPAVKVVCSLPDYPLLPWKSCFWYRASDGILLKAEERRGPPWEPMTIVELVKETPADRTGFDIPCP